MVLSLRSVGALRRAGAIIAGLLLATGVMAGTASADVGTVTITSNQSPNPVAATGSATYSIRVVNDSSHTDRYFKVTAISYARFLPRSLLPHVCGSTTTHRGPPMRTSPSPSQPRGRLVALITSRDRQGL